MGAVIGVGIADIERQMIARPGVHLRRAHRIEPFRRLPVAFGELRPELARPFADVIVRDEVVAPVVLLLPDFELALFLEDARHDGRGAGHPLRLHLGEDLLRQLLFRVGVHPAQCRIRAADQDNGCNQETGACDIG